MTHGLEVPNSAGLFGGYPGSCVKQTLCAGSDLLKQHAAGHLPTRIEDLFGDRVEMGPKPGLMPLHPGDVFQTSWQGGGGFGDPLDRDPDDVREDVDMGRYSPAFAQAIYGVVLDGDKLDETVTRATRSAMKVDRLKGASPAPAPQMVAVDALDQPIGGALRFGRIRGKRWFACACGQALAPEAANWRDGVICRKVQPAQINTNILLHAELEMRQYLCPSCGSSMSVDVLEKSAAHPHDIKLRVGG
jgi:N-methylhydantoinase B